MLHGQSRRRSGDMPSRPQLTVKHQLRADRGRRSGVGPAGRLEGNQLRRQLPTSENHATRLGGGAFCACKAGPSRLFMNCS